MKYHPALLLVILMTLIVSACSPFNIAESPREQPTPREDILPALIYQSVEVVQVEIETGVGSPIPVHAIVSGNLPDSCAQLELIQQRQEGTKIRLWLASVPSTAEGCVQDTLPFRIALPLNVVNLPAGSYSVNVNGVSASFVLDTENTTSSLPASDSPVSKGDIIVDSVSLEAGVGSPIPVHAVASLRLPNTCAQLGEVRMHRQGDTFSVWLIADIVERDDCSSDSIPFLARIPLNIVNLPDGLYSVDINGTTASFDPRSLSLGLLSLEEFEGRLKAAIQERNIAQMQALMDGNLILAYWRSESVTYPAEEAAQQLAENYLPAGSLPVFHSFLDLPGFDPAAMAGPDVDLARILHLTGLGADADGEALLLIARRPDGLFYWHSMLITQEGFVRQELPAGTPA